jgi:hypothetical protein
MDLSHEYNLAREHVKAIDFTYLFPRNAPPVTKTTYPAIELLLKPSGETLPGPDARIVDFRWLSPEYVPPLSAIGGNNSYLAASLPSIVLYQHSKRLFDSWED